MKVFVSILWWLLAACSASAGQSIQPMPPECPAVALDANLAFSNDPGYENTVAINYRNVSESACTLIGGAGAIFDNWHEGHNIWAKECRNCDASGKPQPAPPLVLQPGESGYFLLRWRNVSEGTESCIDADGFNTNDVTVVAPSLLSHVCSVVDERSFLPGIFSASRSDAGEGPKPAEVAYSIELTAPGSTLFAGDRFPFRALVNDPKGQLALDDRSCPILFVRTRDSHGFTTFQQISGFLKCKLTSTLGVGRSIEVEMYAPGLGVLNMPGPTSIRFFMLVGPAQARDGALIASNALAMTIVDPATLPPAWGPEVGRLAVSLVLDKQEYPVGENIPLRINIENFGASQDIGSGELPCFAGLSIEVRDSAGSVVPWREPNWRCTGHGRQTKYPVGKQFYVRGLTLSSAGALPDRPGNYSVMVIWNASSLSGQPDKFGRRPLQPYAVVRSRPVSFRILDQAQ
jgi:hypothetical protein